MPKVKLWSKIRKVLNFFTALLLVFQMSFPGGFLITKAQEPGFTASGGGSGANYVGKINFAQLENLVLTDNAGGSFEQTQGIVIEFSNQISGTSLEFDTTSPVTATPSGTVQVNSPITSSNQISIPVTVDSEPDDAVTISGIRVKATSGSNSSGTEKLKITAAGGTVLADNIQVDLQGPSINSLAPAPGSFTNNQKPTISAHLSDQAGIDVPSIRLRINNVLLPASFVDPIVSYIPVSNLSERTYNVTLNVKDTLGNSASTSWSFTIDITPPFSVSITEPGNGALIHGDGVVVSGQAQDAKAGVDHLVFQYSQDQSTWNDIGSNNSFPYSVIFDTETGFGPPLGGIYYLRAVAFDRAGNSAASLSIWVDIDNVPPDVPTLTPEPDTNNPRPTLEWSDESASGAIKYHIQISKNSDFSSSIVDDSNVLENSYTPSFNLIESTYYWRVSAIDEYGNESGFSAVDSFYTDYTEPQVSSVTLSPLSPISTGEVAFSITFDEQMDQSVSPAVSFGLESPYEQHIISGSWQNSTTWQGIFEVTQLTGDGTNTLKIAGGKDLVGNVMDDNTSNTLIIDTTAPQVTVLSPDGGEIYAGGAQINISWQTSGNNLKTKPISLYYKTNGVWVSIAENEANDGNYSWSAPSINSQNILVKVEVEDRAGNVGVDISNNVFTIDSEAPSVSLTDPTGGEVLKGGSSLNIQWTASDNFGLAENPITLEYYDGANWQIIAGGLSNSGSYSWTLSNINSTQVKVRISAFDAAGNTTLVESDSFVIDSTSPQISSLAPAPDFYISDDQPTVSAILLDNLSGINTSTIEFWGGLYEATVPLPYDYNPDTGLISWTPLSPLYDGLWVFELTVSDNAGNTQTATWSFTIDAVAPNAPDATKITLNQNPPESDDAISGQAGAVEGSSIVKVYSDAALTTIIDQTNASADGSFSKISLGDNTYPQVWVTATDRAQNQSEATSFLNDIVAPNTPDSVNIAPTSPTNNNTPTVSGSVDLDVTTVEIQVDFQTFQASASDGSFSYELSVLSDEVYTIRVRAIDGAGNTSDWVTVADAYMIDTAAPVISDNSPENSSYLNYSDLTIQANITDPDSSGVNPNSIQMVINEAPPSVIDPIDPLNPGLGYLGWDGTTARYHDESAEDGIYNVIIFASDFAGNPATSLSFSFQIDTVSPDLAVITSPSSGANLRGTVEITATASDNESGSGIGKVEFYWATSPEDFGLIGEDTEAPYQVSWDTTTRVDGLYVLVAIPYDKAGNVSAPEEPTVFVLVDNTLPSVSITSPTGGVFSDGILISAEANDSGSEIEKVEFYYNGTVIGETTEEISGLYQITWGTTSGNPTDGWYNLSAIAYDKAGNSQTSDPVSIYVDNTVPHAPIITSYTNPINLSNVNFVSISGTGEANTTALITFSDGTNTLNPEASVDGNGHFLKENLNLSLLSDGQITITVLIRDPAGNVSEPATASAFKDTVVPNAPTVTSPSSNFYVNQNNASSFGPITGTAEAGVRVDLRISGGESQITDSVQLSNSQTDFSFGLYDLSGFPEGAVTISVTVTDAVGNVSNPATVSGQKDIASVTITDLSPADGSNLSDGTNDNIYPLTISAEITDPGSSSVDPDSILMTINGLPLAVDFGLSWNGTTISYFDSEAWDGTYTITLSATDLAGNPTTSVSWSFKIDSQPPTGSISINSGATYTNLASVTLNLSASDPIAIDETEGSGVLEMSFSDDGVNWTGWENYSSSKDWILQDSDGLKTLSVKFKDAAENISESSSDSIILDRVVDTGASLNALPAYTTGSSVNLSWIPGSDTNGIASYQLQKEGTWETIYQGLETSYSDSNIVDGQSYTYRVKTVDVAGNEAPSNTVSTIVDRTPPYSGSLIINSGAEYTTSWNVTLTISALDATSGVCKMNIANHTSYAGWEPYATSKTWTLPATEGVKTVRVKFKDCAGNENPSSITSDTIILDYTAPSAPTNLLVSPSSWTNQNNFSISWTNPTELSGVTGAYYKLDSPPTFNEDGLFVAGDGLTSISGITVSGDGSHSIYVWLKDKAGNIYYVNRAETILLLDTQAPSAPVSLSSTPSGWDDANNFSVSWTNPADTSGIAGAYYKLDTPPISNTDGIFVAGDNLTSIPEISVSSPGKHLIYIWLKDAAGNINYVNNATTNLCFDEVLGEPAPVTDLTATPLAGGYVRLDWTTSTSADKAKYHIYRNDSEVAVLTDMTATSWTEPNPLTGTFTYYLVTEDTAGRLSSHSNSATVTTDATPPSFSNISVLPSYAKAGTTITITFSVSEEISSLTVKVANNNTSCSNDGLNYTCAYLVSGTESEGQNQITFSATDLAGNPGTTSSSVILDFTAPVISNGSPQGSTTDLRPTISANISDSGGSGINPATITMNVNGVPVSTSFNDTTVSWYPSSNLRLGRTYYVVVNAKDNAGNSAVQYSFSFTVVSGVGATTYSPNPPASTVNLASSQTEKILGSEAENKTTQTRYPLLPTIVLGFTLLCFGVGLSLRRKLQLLDVVKLVRSWLF